MRFDRYYLVMSPSSAPPATGPAETPPKRRKAAPPFPGLSHKLITATALALIDELGLDVFSIRTLSKRLSVYPTAIYWYVPSRNQLLSDVVALALESVPAAPAEGTWQGYLRDLFRMYREAFRSHPNIAPLVGAQLLSNASVDFVFLEGLLETMSKAGFSGAGLVGAYNSIIASLVGFVTQEFAPLPSEDTENWRANMRARLSEIDRDRYPVLAANIGNLANRAFILRWDSGAASPLDASFLIFVEVLIKGLEALRLEAS